MLKVLRALSFFLLIQVLSSSGWAQLLPTGTGTKSVLSPERQEALVNRVRGVFDPSLIPSHLRHAYTTEVPRCATGTILEAVRDWDRLSFDTRTKLSTFFQRPSNQRSYSSTSGKFLIHYDVSGLHKVDVQDDDGNGIPDYVDLVAATFDDMWVREIDGLGYREPIDDGDGVYDVHIQQLGLQGVYGLAFPTGGFTSASHIQIDNNYTDNIFQTRGQDGVQVTAAHEFFHAIQFAYYAPLDAGWWQELTATWMEDVMFDDVNDYYQYQPFFFESPETSLDEYPFSGLQPFAASIFGHYLEQTYGASTIRDTWESLGTHTPTSYDISDVDVGLPGGFASVLPRFVVWNYLTGSRHIPGYYEEGAVYGEVNPRSITPVSGVSVGGSARVDHLASTYISIDTGGLSGGLQIAISLESGSEYEIVMMLFRGGSPEVVRLQGDEVTIANVSQYDEVVLAPISISTTGSNFDIGYSVLNSTSITSTSDRVGDFDRDGTVAFADFLSFAESYGKDATDSDHVQDHDLNADGDIGFTDFLIFASHFGE
jgi:hypothetical protein